MKYLKKAKSYIGSLIVFSFMLQVTAPLVAAVSFQDTTTYPAPQRRSALIADDTINTYIATIVDDAKQAWYI